MAKQTIKKTENNSKGFLLRAYCLSCERITKQKVLQSINIDGTEQFSDHPGDEFNWLDEYQIIQCEGCENISFRHYHTDTIDRYIANGDEVVGTEKIYPRTNKMARPKRSFTNLPKKLCGIYDETMSCLNSGNHLLGAGGVRALVDGLCNDKGIASNKKLVEKIDEMVRKGFLTQANADSLHELRFMGNEALHELAAPSDEDLLLGIDIIENIFTTVYDLPSKGAALKAKRLTKGGSKPAK